MLCLSDMANMNEPLSKLCKKSVPKKFASFTEKKPCAGLCF